MTLHADLTLGDRGIAVELTVADGETHVDGTFGAGGYTRALLDAAPGRGWDFANFRPVVAAAE